MPGFNGSGLLTFLLFLGIGILAGRIARSKGRSAWGWGLLAFFIPITILIPIFLKPVGIPDKAL